MGGMWGSKGNEAMKRNVRIGGHMFVEMYWVKGLRGNVGNVYIHLFFG